MGKRINKVEEPTAAYDVTKPPSTAKEAAGQPCVRYARHENVLKTNEKVMRVHREVLQKLAR